VRVHSAGGSIAIENLSGTFSGETGGGTITMTGASGTASLSTGGGAIRVVDSDLGGTITTGAGEVDLRNSRGDLRATSSTVGATGAANRDESGSLYESMKKNYAGSGFGYGAGSATTTTNVVRGVA